jgi:hypothetical protein
MYGGEGGEMGSSGGPDYSSSGGMYGSEGESESGGMEKGGDGLAGAVASKDPADNRYLSFAPETEFSPVLGQQLRDAIKNINAGNAVDAVAKRVPIRMRLKVDPNHLSTLIAECGNANMMLEVYQYRLNTAPAPTSGSGGGYSGGGYEGGGGGKGAMGMDGGAGMPGGDEMGMGGDAGTGSEMGSGEGGYGSGMPGGGYGGGGYGGATGSGGATALKAMNEVSVEIFGLIYLYNPVNMGSLVEAVEAAAEQAGAENSGTTTNESKPANPQPKPAAPANTVPAAQTDANTTAPAESNAADSVNSPAAPADPVNQPTNPPPNQPAGITGSQ